MDFVKTVAVMFAVPKYGEALASIAKGYGINTTFKHKLIEVNGNKALFQSVDNNEIIEKTFDFLHVVPPMRPHPYIAESGLADSAGYLDVDKNTTRHNKYGNIWGIGDASSLPNSKTAAAIFSQNIALVRYIFIYSATYFKL